jgi:acyl-coenzyme A synthetase/AMP-(fatty) acid ligase
MLALAALSQGIVWSSCSPDFGVEGVLERFGQIEPKVLFCADGYRYNGETTIRSSASPAWWKSCRACARSWSCRISIRRSTCRRSRRR